MNMYINYMTHLAIVITVNTEICGKGMVYISHTELQVNNLSIWLTAMAGHLYTMPAMTIIKSL